jgi:hypothetical protein
MKRICESCDGMFTPHPKVPDQKFCRSKLCQKERRRRWQQNKRAIDKNYRDNQIDAQKAWLKRNPGYWKKYRRGNLKYKNRNCRLQKERNNKRKKLLNMPNFVKPEIAKMDELNKKNNIISGNYRLVLVDKEQIAKMDELIVKIEIISRG